MRSLAIAPLHLGRAGGAEPRETAVRLSWTGGPKPQSTGLPPLATLGALPRACLWPQVKHLVYLASAQRASPAQTQIPPRAALCWPQEVLGGWREGAGERMCEQEPDAAFFFLRVL